MYSLQQVESRRSVRTYTGEPLTIQQINAIGAEISQINSFMRGTRFQFFTENSRPFSGILGGYGSFRNVTNYVAAVMDTGVENHREIAGFAAEKVVMRATTLGLGTCIVRGTYDATKIEAQLRAGEKVLFIITIGYTATGKQRITGKIIQSFMHRKTMAWSDFYDEKRSSYTLKEACTLYPKLKEALKAVACAPSALNKRPVRIRLDEEKNIRASVADYSGYAPIDLGVAKFNFQSVFDGEWDFGNDTPFYPIIN